MRNAPAVLGHPEAGPRMECFVIEGSLPEQENARASDHDARASKNADRRALLAERVEAEIERIREARPHLSSRLDRASNLLLLQLASPLASGPLR